MAYPQLVQRTEEVDQSSLKSLVCERFGISDSVFDNLVFFRSNSRLVSIVNKDHVPVEGHGVEAKGITFLHAQMRFPKLTTAAVFFIGGHSTRNVVELSRGQTDGFLSRQTLSLDDEAVKCCTSQGYVVVKHEGVVMGLGFLRFPAEGGAELESYFPKSWSIEQGGSAFGRPESVAL